MRSRFSVSIRYVEQYDQSYVGDVHAIWYTPSGRQERLLGSVLVATGQPTAGDMVAEVLEALAGDVRRRLATAVPPTP